MKTQFLFFLYLLLFCNIGFAQPQKNPLYEFRGVWVASVVNCDFPSSKNLTTDEQKAEFIKLADLHQRNGMNALIVQVRLVAMPCMPANTNPGANI